MDNIRGDKYLDHIDLEGRSLDLQSNKINVKGANNNQVDYTKSKVKLKVWRDYPYQINKKSVITDTIINLSINSFWKNIVEKDNINKFGLFFKVAYSDGYIRTIGNMQKSSNSEQNKELLKNTYKILLSFKDKWYKEKYIENIIFTYKKLSDNTEVCISLPNELININSFEFKGMNLPNNADLTLWGDGRYKI